MTKTKNIKLELCGYFDSNFGDDYMQKIVVHYLNEYDFYIDKKYMISPLVLAEGNVHVNDAEKICNQLKVMVTGSGFMVNNRRALIYEIIWLLQSKHIADYCIGCNIEPFKNKLSEQLVIKKLNKFKCIICRDKKSLAWLKKHCPNAECAYMPDILFAMPRSWLPEKSGEKNLGIALMHRMGDKSGSGYYRSMAEIADFWVQTTGRAVLLMAFDTGEENDVFACECVKAMMRYGDNAEIVKHGGNGEILNAYAACSKVIGARFHAGVLAIKMSIDFYPIIYREKLRNLISDMQYPIKGCDISNIDTEDIKEFLCCEKVDFRLDGSYVRQAEKGIAQLENRIKRDLAIPAENA